MKKRMNKNNLLKLIKTLKVDKDNFWIVSSGALVLRNIYPDAGDLDIIVTDNGLMQLENNYNLIPKPNGGFIINDDIECICCESKNKLKYHLEKVEGYYVQNIKEYWEYLNNSDREKDKFRIPIVKQYIKNR